MIPKQKFQEESLKIIEALNMLKDDESVPKNVKAKIVEILLTIKDDTDPQMKMGKALHTLDEISEDLNLQPFIRTQVWNISSMLETLNK
ncbi:MAG: UPF0147 family protein [Candidatus Woesearchaeota archaeon]